MLNWKNFLHRIPWSKTGQQNSLKTPHINTFCSKLSPLNVNRRMKNISDTMTAKTVNHTIFWVSWVQNSSGTTAGNPQRVLKLKKPTIWIYNLQLREAFWELKMFNVVTIYIMEAITYAHIKAPGTARIGTQIH